MVEVTSGMLPLGTEMPPFELPDFDGRIVSSSDYEGAAATLVMFHLQPLSICPSCPAGAGLAGRRYRDRGVAVIAINSNDVATYPQDEPDGVRDEANQAGCPFPYLFDESQQGRQGIPGRLHTDLLRVRRRLSPRLSRPTR